ncbi:hypothetical protein DID73_00055 [Candidatus Marinamargulisbacteria bacterium SCGC AG-343-K17]|nr:hypothetical protein DID73_00055 [Candidatus Marinamargulisbacteria bacterium SCGC AG-343-K17]
MKKIIKTIKLFWPAFIPIVLLNIVALRQIYLSNVDHLDAWKGGGFGMFSRVHKRYYHIHLLNRGAFECAVAPDDYFTELHKIQYYPKYLSLEQLTKLLTKKLWVYNNIKSKNKSVVMIGKNAKLRPGDKIAHFDAIEIQVFDMKFTKKSFTLEPKLIRKISYLK